MLQQEGDQGSGLRAGGLSVAGDSALAARTVASTPVKEEDWAPVLSSVGSISAVQGAVVSAELGGTVSEVKFQNGGEAKKGDLLIQLDTSSERAQLRSAEADLTPDPEPPSAGERHPNIYRAINALGAAEGDLQNAAHDYCGHRVEALGAVQNALSQLKLAIQCDKK